MKKQITKHQTNFTQNNAMTQGREEREGNAVICYLENGLESL
jgi:hypothetical protein